MPSEKDEPLKLLMLGSSGVRFSDPEEGRTLPELIEDELNRSEAGTWKVDSELVYPMPNMPERVMSYVEKHMPQALLLTLGATVFAEESVMFNIRRRFPRLYGPASRLIAAGKALAGGGPEGSASVRGAVFRAPGRLAARVLGTAPLVEPADALNATIATLELVAALPNLPVACRLANGHFQHRDQAAEVARRTATYNERVREACLRLGITVYGQRDAIAERSFGYTMSGDGLHTDYETRERAAAVAAVYVLQALGAAGEAGKRVPATSRE